MVFEGQTGDFHLDLSVPRDLTPINEHMFVQKSRTSSRPRVGMGFQNGFYPTPLHLHVGEEGENIVDFFQPFTLAHGLLLVVLLRILGYLPSYLRYSYISEISSSYNNATA